MPYEFATRTTVCEFCGHRYIQPCDKKQAKKCMNIKLTDPEHPANVSKRVEKKAKAKKKK